MKVRVRFRFNADTGEVEMFRVDAVDADASAVDHDRRHDAATVRLARVVEANARIDEIHGEAAQIEAETRRDESDERRHERDRVDPSRG